MIEEVVVVVAIEGGRIWVEKSGKSVCGSCNHSCPSARVAEPRERRSLCWEVFSPIAVEKGDRVVVGVPEKAVVVGSLGIYLFPLLGLLGGAILGKGLSLFLIPTAADLAAALGGVAGMAGSYGFLGLTPALARRVPPPVVLRKLD